MLTEDRRQKMIKIKYRNWQKHIWRQLITAEDRNCNQSSEDREKKHNWRQKMNSEVRKWYQNIVNCNKNRKWEYKPAKDRNL